MKSLSLALLSFAMLPMQSFAATSQVSLSRSAVSQTVQVTDQKMAPIYGTEDYQTTCSEQVVDHYDTECHDVADQVCSSGPDVCEDVPDQVCNSQGCTSITRRQCSSGPEQCTPITRSECDQEPVCVERDYACTQTRTIITGYTLVKTFNHTITISAANADILAAASLAITLNVTEDKVTPVLSNTYPAALLNYAVTATVTNNSDTVEALSENIVIDVAAKGAALTAFAADTSLALALGKSAIHVELPGAADLANDLNFNIRIQKHRTLWLPTDLVNKSFDSSTLGLTTQGSDVKADIGLAKLGITGTLDGSQFSVWVTATLKSGNYLNAADFNAAISASVTQTLNKVKTSF